jgi:hypothetical protein
MKKTLFTSLISAVVLSLFADKTTKGLALEYLKLRNRVALEILSGNEDGVEKSIQKATSLRTKATMHTVRCETCKGARPFIVTEPDEGQNTGRIKKSEMLGQHKVICPICKGKGSIRTFKDIDDIEKEFSSALRTFEAKNLAEGLIKTNGAYLTSAQLEKASQLQLESIHSIMGQPCKRCKSSGVSECRKCKGEGFTKCRNSGCKEGWFKFQRKNTSKTKYAPTFKLCPECKGTEKTICPECHGERGRICKDCSGEGFTHKKR